MRLVVRLVCEARGLARMSGSSSVSYVRLVVPFVCQVRGRFVCRPRDPFSMSSSWSVSYVRLVVPFVCQ